MGRARFVAPETVRLDLSDGDYVEVKRRLTYGDRQQLQTAALASLQDRGELGSERISLDWARAQARRLEIYLVDWSFRDERGKRVAVSPEAIASLDPDTADEIHAALDKYLEQQEGEKKVVTTGAG